MIGFLIFAVVLFHFFGWWGLLGLVVLFLIGVEQQ